MASVVELSLKVAESIIKVENANIESLKTKAKLDSKPQWDGSDYANHLSTNFQFAFAVGNLFVTSTNLLDGLFGKKKRKR